MRFIHVSDYSSSLFIYSYCCTESHCLEELLNIYLLIFYG